MKTSQSYPTTKFTYRHLVAYWLILLVCFGVTQFMMGGGMDVHTVAQNNFITSMNAMKNIKGSGFSIAEMLGCRDHWLYFESQEPIVLKNEATYHTVPMNELKWKASLFKIYTPESQALSDLENLSCVEFNKRAYPITDEKFLLVNNRTHEYFFHDAHIESDGF